MASGQRFSGYSAELGYSTSQTIDLADVQGVELNPNNEVALMRPAGALDPSAYLLARTRPTFSLQTPDITTALTDISFTAGKYLDEQSTFPVQERTHAGAFESGSTHTEKTIEDGFVYIDNISAADDDQAAQMNLIVVPHKKAGSDIVVTTGASALPSITPAFVSAFFLGPVYHNSVEIPGLVSSQVSPGLNYQPSPSTPGAYADLGSIVSREAVFTHRFLKVDEFDSNQITGDAVNTSWAVYFQKADATYTTTDGRVAKASTVHLKVSCTAGRIEMSTFSFNGIEDAGIEVRVTPTGTVSMSIASAIP